MFLKHDTFNWTCKRSLNSNLKEITTTEADRLAFFTYYNNRPANSIQEAIEFWDDFEPGV